jgi:regulator of PEP synthase PpsR (kinase-PPPase family)
MKKGDFGDMPPDARYLFEGRIDTDDRDDFMDEPKNIIIISDGTGKTAKRLMDAVLAQYSDYQVSHTLEEIYPQVRDKKAINKILAKIDDSYLVIYSIISEDLDKYFHERLKDMEILHLNILRPMLITMSKFLGVRPDYRPGILHVVDDKYYKKVDAIGYTVEHDDGGGGMLEEADIVLLGLSRTCKTPISMYLACNFGYKVANIPIVNDEEMTKNLLKRVLPISRDKIFGLLMHPEILAHAREERSYFLSRAVLEREDIRRYYDLDEVRKEYRFCRELYEKYNWEEVDVTRRAIEEISLEILEKRGLRNGGGHWLDDETREGPLG